MDTIRKILFISTVIFCCAGCDQVTKAAAVKYLEGHLPISFMGEFFTFQFAENTGAMLSLGHNMPVKFKSYIFVIGVSIALFLSLGYVFVKKLHYLSVFGFSLYIGGGIGNLLDRIFNNGAVIDFMLIKMGPLKTGIFNVADVVIIIGIVLLIIGSMLFQNTREVTK